MNAGGKPVTAPVFCDAANGAGAEGAVLVGLQLTEICGQQIAVRNTGRSPSCHPVVPSDVPRDTLDSSTSLINERCGSEVVHMQKILPQQFGMINILFIAFYTMTQICGEPVRCLSRVL